ncbi:MAG: hypothetical protein AAGA45_04555 [Verrucomicrobiota bacterium]
MFIVGSKLPTFAGVDGLTLLAVLAALCAYLSAVRLWLIPKVKHAVGFSKGVIKAQLVIITFADALLIISAGIVFYFLFFGQNCDSDTAAWWSSTTKKLLAVALIILFLGHLAAWIKAGHSLFKE